MQIIFGFLKKSKEESQRRSSKVTQVNARNGMKFEFEFKIETEICLFSFCRMFKLFLISFFYCLAI